MNKMYLTSSNLCNAIENYKRAKTYEPFNVGEAVSRGMNVAYTGFMLFIALLFFLMEILLVYYSIVIAIRCTKPGPERIIHFVLAITFTLPYMLINVMFSECARKSFEINL